MRSYGIESLKEGHVGYNSGSTFNWEVLKGVLDRMYKRVDVKKGKEELKMVVAKKKEEGTVGDRLIEKYSGVWSRSEENRGHLLYRYLMLNEAMLKHDMREKRSEDMKEITRMGKNMGITFGKKNPNEAFYGTFLKIFNVYISLSVPLTVASLQDALVKELADFEVKLNEEILQRMKNMFEYLFKKSDVIMSSPIYDELNEEEHIVLPDLEFEELRHAGEEMYELPEEEIDLDMDFDDLDLIQNEFVTKEQSDGIDLLFRSSKRREEEKEEKPEVKVGVLGTDEDVKRLGRIEDMRLVESNKTTIEEDAQTHSLSKQVKSDTKFREFYNKFRSTLCKNEYWQISLFSCLDLLSDMGQSTDLLFDQLLNHLGGDIEMAMYLSENRKELVADFIKTRSFMEKKGKKGSNKKYISNMRTSKETSDETGRTNHEILSMLGMTNKEIKTEERLGLAGKGEHALDEYLEETYGTKEEDLFDFVNLNLEQVQTRMGSSYTKSDFEQYMVCDCKPEAKIEVPEGELFKTSNFKPHIAEIFKDVPYLNQLQTKVREVAFESDENMLICAPTGAGKTNVALLTILREFNKTYDEVKRKTGDFKVVYISPLKALATEIVEKFTSKLGHAGVVVREFTGDMSLTKQELLETHIIVSTPEKWDVMTRKSDIVTELVKMIIIDEIHLLDEERGRVLECIVARTSMTIERKQKNIRLVGLSATLPNYLEVASFMKVKKGLFYFDDRYRPVPLYKKFIGVRNPRDMSKKPGERKKTREDEKDVMNKVLYDIVRDNMMRKEQVLIFVHSRKDTVKVGMTLLDMAQERGDLNIFVKPSSPIKENLLVNKDLKSLVSKGIGAHNAGLCRKDRRLIETGFLDGVLRIVTCTATLAWGVNLPAHTVVIKGTDVYEPGVGFKDLSILDVQQIFGRAGRPQFDSYGEAILITKIEKLNYFIGMMTMKTSIKSQFEGILLEAINAEISLGNITTVGEAIDYIRRSFYYVRAKKNPRTVGARTAEEVDEVIHSIVETRLDYLNDLKFIRYDRNNLLLESTELGRICSHYYVNCPTMEKFCKYLNFYEEQPGSDHKMNVDMQGDIEDQDLLAILAQASEFDQLQVRPEEVDEIKKLEQSSEFLEPVHPEFKRLLTKMENKLEKKDFKEFKDELTGAGNADKNEKQHSSYEKVMLLIQGYLCMQSYDNYSLVADTHYIVQNGSRILRCLYEICLKKNIAFLATTVLKMCRSIENNVREDLTCMRMFCFENVKRGVLNIRRGQDIKDSKSFLEDLTCKKIEKKMGGGEGSNYGVYSSVRNMREETDLALTLKISNGEANKLKKLLFAYPLLDVVYSLRPIAQTILKVDLSITPQFYYSKQFHLGKENFECIVEHNGEILHHEEFGIITKHLLKDKAPQATEISFFVPFKEGVEAYNIYIMSDRFVGADVEIELDLKSVQLHSEKMEYTNLLDLRPLKVSVLNNPVFEKLYKISYFNPIQTQVFHALYYTDHNVLIGAPTGSGKTIMAELAMLRLFNKNTQEKVVYIGPYKALVKERLLDWKKRLETKEMGKKVVELTGDYTPDLEALINADVLVTTPEKWDGISRNWQNRNYVQKIGLIVFDEIHLLGQDRGPVIEVIVSRMNYISQKLTKKIRFVGLSTAMASASDVANWFGVPKHYMFSFRPNVRPVPVEIHFKGFAEKNYCPRMNSMNKPAFNDIRKFSPHEPVLIFVSSRRQTRLTALDLITLQTSEAYGRSGFLRMTPEEIESVVQEVKDTNLKQTLAFGIGMHHAGLVQNDRKIIEHLFVENKIQVLIATSTLAWGVNFPAKLVIIKGTEFFDPKSKQYVDMPITDILQMVGRAGRPQFNDKGFACVYVEKSKKNFYRKYLNDPFPIESRLLSQLSEHLNAEINSGTISNKQNCLDYLTWTYWFRRISKNPLFYEIANNDASTIKQHLTSTIDSTCAALQASGCITVSSDGFTLSPSFLGHIASYYYIQHKTVKFLAASLGPNLQIYDLLKILSHCEEFSEVPMRHNEENLNLALANICPYEVDKKRVDDPKIKTLLLLQAYFSDIPLPIRDYITDMKLVLDSCVRFIQAMIDITADKGHLDTLLNLINLSQLYTQGCWRHKSSLINVPHFTEESIKKLKKLHHIEHMCQLIELVKEDFKTVSSVLKSIDNELTEHEMKTIVDAVRAVPDVHFNVKLFDFDSETMQPVLEKDKKIKNKDELYVVANLKRVNNSYPLCVNLKKLTKNKDFSWWIVIGNREENIVYNVKKIFFKSSLHRQYQCSVTASKSSKVDILLMSDSFVGIDQILSYDLNEYTTKNPPVVHEKKKEE